MKKRINICMVFILMATALETINAGNWDRLVNLRGGWKFSIGDDANWASSNFDDSGWEIIKVPSTWEDEGFHGYNGYAWYRKHFKVPYSIKDRMITLKLGRIDDVDEVYVNGKLVGSSGTFPPHYETAYWAWREYPIQSNFLNYDKENVIAVRVYDSQLGGGIVEGEIGLFELEDAMRLDYNLAGVWKFKIGDDMDWKEQKFDDGKWQKIRVPASWDVQGYKNYDGFAWYRTTFKVPSNLSGKKLVLVLGRIDDIDEAYVNGKLVGSTGDMNDGDPFEYNRDNEYQQLRGYYIPKGLIEADKEVVIAVRVYDGYNIGGIYEGQIGLIDQNRYIKYWKEHRDDYKWKNKSPNDIWDWIFNND